MQAQAMRASSRAGANPTWGEWEAYAGDVLAEADEAHGDWQEDAIAPPT